LTLAGESKEQIDPERVVGVLRDHCQTVSLKRLDSAPRQLEMLFLVEVPDFQALNAATGGIEALDSSIRVSYMDRY
jgi:hypothetical protein